MYFKMNTETENQTNLPATANTAAVPAIIGPSSSALAINKYLNEEVPAEMIGKLIRFTKGEYLRGIDAEEVPEGSLFTLACDLTMRGFIYWLDGKPADQRVVRIASGTPLPRREDMGHMDKSVWPSDGKGPVRDPVQPVMYLPMMSQEGELCTFTTGSKGGMDLINRTLRRYATHTRRYPDDYPMIRLAVDSYQHSDRSIGKVFVPDFAPAGYINRAEFMEALEAVGVAVDTPEKAAALPAPSVREEINDRLDF
jgi:hypothetical protein